MDVNGGVQMGLVCHGERTQAYLRAVWVGVRISSQPVWLVLHHACARRRSKTQKIENRRERKKEKQNKERREKKQKNMPEVGVV